ncbi:MAG: hypothetical protein JSR39_08080 [Verrucomicrobia bacterium]|nr:hypothetical protein [Verrucomicrobiota bacterium]
MSIASTASSIRSGHPDTCFQHVPFAEIIRPSEKLKENYIAAYTEVDRIDWALDEEQTPDKIKYLAERLITIQDFNNALADYIVKTVTNWDQCGSKQEFPSEVEYRRSNPRGDYSHDKTMAHFRREKAWEEVFQVKSLGTFCEQLSKKITRVFQRAPLVEFQSRLTPQVNIIGQLPEFERLFWQAPRIQGEMPKPSIDFSSTTPQTASLSEQPSSSSASETSAVSEPIDGNKPNLTARIVVNYEGNDGDKLYIRGTGPNMSWGPGIELRKEGSQWIYESSEPFETFNFKLMLNDQLWETGDNHTVESGKPFELSSVTFHDLS